MAWPKLRNRRSPASPVTVSDRGGAAAETSAPSHEAVSGAPGAPGRPVSGEAATAGQDAGDVAFWKWAAEPAEPDDPSDVFPPDRPEYPDGPDPEYRAAVGTEPRRAAVTPAGDGDGEPRRDGIAQHLGDLAHLSGNPRMRVWQRRIIIGIVAGVAFGFLLHDWRWGLTFAVLAAIADTVIRSRTVPDAPAGLRLTGAQKRTMRQLSSLERKGYRAMHLLPIPDSTEQIDHLVIGPAGVFAIDSEDWDRRMPVRTSSHRQLWHGPRNMKDRLEHAHWEADQAAGLLSAAMGSPVTVRPVLAVYGPDIMWDVAEIRDVDVFSGPRLRKYLRRRARRREAHPLGAGEIERIDKAAHTAFPHDTGD